MNAHRRRNALTGEWVLVSPHRDRRPWHGQVEPVIEAKRPTHDPACYLCPGTSRADGQVNPRYTGTYVFDNDFPALTPDGAEALPKDPLLQAKSEAGVCRVVCFSPRHDLTLAELSRSEIRQVVDTWVAETAGLGARPEISYVQIFENKGELMGCSNPHPHGQIWAQRSIPEEPAKELREQSAYYARHGRTLLTDYLERERALGDRIVCENESFTALVPFWATWPFETLLISRRAVPHLGELTDYERNALADLMKRITTRYDNLFRTSFPYSAGVHQAPFDSASHPEWHLHMHFYPPLLRSATVRKFMVGYEMLGEPQRDITPEAAAQRLRELSETHYTNA